MSLRKKPTEKEFAEWSKKSPKEKFEVFEKNAETKNREAIIKKANEDLDRIEKGRPRGDARPGWAGDEDLLEIYKIALRYGDFKLSRRVEDVRRKLHPI
jgi:hypothetical protein